MCLKALTGCVVKYSYREYTHVFLLSFFLPFTCFLALSLSLSMYIYLTNTHTHTHTHTLSLFIFLPFVMCAFIGFVRGRDFDFARTYFAASRAYFHRSSVSYSRTSNDMTSCVRVITTWCGENTWATKLTCVHLFVPCVDTFAFRAPIVFLIREGQHTTDEKRQ